MNQIPPPKISVIVPVYNAEKHLDTCLNSIKNQTFRDIEIICIDDGSNDKSRSILFSAAKADNRFRITHNEKNQGVSATRNTGLALAIGNYIFYLDADDTIPLDALEHLYTAATEYRSDVVKGGYVAVHPDGDKITMDWASPKVKTVNTNIYRSEFLQQIPTGHWSYLYKRQLLNQYNIRFPVDLIVGEDLVTLASVLTAAKKITLIPEIIYHYHLSDSSTMHGKLTEKKVIDATTSKQLIANILEENGLYDAATRQLTNWDYIISELWTRAPEALGKSSCKNIFTNFRYIFNNKKLLPWNTRTPIHNRYILALILNNMDKQAVSFLSREEKKNGLAKDDWQIEQLNFILSKHPEDPYSLLALSRISQNSGDLKKALELSTKAMSTDKGIDAHIQSIHLLNMLCRYKDSNEILNTVIEKMNHNQALSSQANTLISLKYQTTKLELEAELTTLRNELSRANRELDCVYTSASWKITHPLRKICSYLKN